MMAGVGYYTMARGWQEAEIFGNDEYSTRDAWVWLIEAAAWKPAKARIKGQTIELQRGQLCFSQRFMADKWRWSKSRVDRFLKRLVAESMISSCAKTGATAGHPAGQGQAIITICNYDKYQAPEKAVRGNDQSETGATAGQQRGKEEEGKEIKKEKISADAPCEYAFAGSVIRLRPEQFDKWASAYPGLDLRATLQSRDDWLSTKADAATRKNWFMSTSNHLANLHNQAAKPRAPVIEEFRI